MNDYSFDIKYNFQIRCRSCNKLAYINIIFDLCNDCIVKSVNYQFNTKINNLSKYILFSSIKNRVGYNIIKLYYLKRLKEFNENENINNILDDFDELDTVIKNLKNNIIFHPGYPSISTFISLQKYI